MATKELKLNGMEDFKEKIKFGHLVKLTNYNAREKELTDNFVVLSTNPLIIGKEISERQKRNHIKEKNYTIKFFKKINEKEYITTSVDLNKQNVKFEENKILLFAKQNALGLNKGDVWLKLEF